MLGLREALDRIAGPAAAAEPPSDPPLLAVDLRDARDREANPALCAALRALPAVSVALAADEDHGASGLAASFDVVVSDPASLDALRAAVAARPQAAVALVQLLRGFDTRTVEAGLVAESVTYGLLQAGAEFADWLAQRGPARTLAPAERVLEVERRGDRLLLTLARPERRNAFGTALRDALCEALAVAHADASITHVALCGLGPDFCSGGDLDEFGCAPDPATAHGIRMLRSPARALAGCADRAHALVHGACVGAGVELPAFCARLEARPDAWFCLPEVGMGLIPGAGGTVSLPRRIGRQRTAWMALSGARVDAATAREWGLVDAVVPG